MAYTCLAQTVRSSLERRKMIRVGSQIYMKKGRTCRKEKVKVKE